MEDIISTALECGLWVHGEYLRDELIGESSDKVDLLGSPLDVTSFLGHYGQDPVDTVYLIHGYLVRVQTTDRTLEQWARNRSSVLSCNSFYRSKHIWLGVCHQRLGIAKLMGMTKRKQFSYVGLPILSLGLDLVSKGWVPLSAPEGVMKQYRQMAMLKLHRAGLQLDLCAKIVSHL
jgi:hypothetical protein